MPGKASRVPSVAELVYKIQRINEGGEYADIDFDHEPELASNRGNKLKRKAPWTHEGRLAGRKTYKQKINHAGYERHILHRKPQRYDQEGIPLDSDEEDEEADADAAERDPYHGVDVQALLMPLTAASDLWQHPGMSHAYTSEALSDMVNKSRIMLRKERTTLSKVKELATRLRGDQIRAPSNLLWAEGDEDLYKADEILKGISELDQTSENLRTPEPIIAVNVVEAEQAADNGAREEGTQAEDVNMAGGDAEPPVAINGVAEALTSTEEADSATSTAQALGGSAEDGHPDRKLEEETSDDVQPAESEPHATSNGQPNGTAGQGQEGDHDVMEEDAPAPRMMTRGAAAAANGTTHEEGSDKPRSPSPPMSLPAIHPAFIPPISSLPDRDLGLPPWEAEDTRKIVNVFVQKQEEVVRGAEKLYDMLLKAERLRKSVYWWSRAEAHAGEMSDGEEWVDQEEWNLEVPLRKGAAEGEEENREEERKGKGRRTRAVA